MINKILMSMSGLMASGIEDGAKDVIQKVTDIITGIMGALLGLVALLGVIYAVVIGIKMARANTPEEREEAKKKVVFTVIALGVTAALIIVMFFIKANIPNWIKNQNEQPAQEGQVAIKYTLSLLGR